MPTIVRPSKVYDFTAFARRQPTSPPPGDRLDAQLANHADAITAVQVAVENLAKTAPAPVDIKALAADIKRFAEAEFGDLRQAALNANVVVDQARLEVARAKADADRARDVADRAEARLAAAQPTPMAQTPTPPDPNPNSNILPTLYVGAGGPYAGDVAGATATAADYAQVAIDWAEFMDANATIPPNILAINSISGDHWSSRWWANRSASAFGMLAWWYQGAWPGMPPTTPLTPTGQPIPIGGMFFNTTTNAMMVWNGSTWINAQSPQKGVSASLYYLASANQTVFPLSVVDRHGRSFAFSAAVPEGVESYVAGDRVEPQFDYAVDYPNSTITFVRPVAAGALVVFDILVPALALAPSGSANTLLVNPIVPDGVTTAFTNLTIAATGLPVAAGKSEELCVSVDGAIQQPGTAYSAVGASITFAEAPLANANVFIVWYGPAVLAGGGGGGVEEAPVDGVGYMRRSAAWSPVGGPYLPLAGGTVAGGTSFTAGILLAGPANLSLGGGTAGQVLTKGASGGSTQWADPIAGGGGIADAPNDGSAYARKSAGWSHLSHLDITDWTANVPAASTTTPPMDGTAAVGTGTTWARADHVHPVDTSRYAASNPSGFQTAAQVTASLAPYATLSYVNAGYLALTGGVVQGPVDLKVQAVTAAATTAINRVNGENVALALGVNVTAMTVSGWPAAGVTGKVRLVIASSGAFAISGWPAGTIWPGGTPPVITSGAGKKDIILLMSDDGGTTIYGSVVGQDYR